MDERVGTWLIGSIVPSLRGHFAISVGGNIARDHSGVRLVGFKLLF